MRALSLTLVGALYVGLSLAVWRAKPLSRVHRSFALQSLAVATWTFGNAGLQTATWLRPSMHLTFAAASLIPPAFLVFAVNYPVPRNSPMPLWQRASVVAGAAFAILSLLTDWLFYDVHVSPAGLYRQQGALYPWFATYFLAVFSAAFIIFATKWQTARHREQVQLNYFGIGVIIAAVGGIATNLVVPWVSGRSSLSYLGPYFGIPFIALTAHTIIRHRFLELGVLIHRGLTFAIAGGVSLIPAAILAVMFWPRLVGVFSVGELLWGVAALLAIGIVIPPTRDMTERVLDHYLYRTRVKPQRLLREAGSALASCVDGRGVWEVLREASFRLTAPEAAALYLRTEDSLVLNSSYVNAGAVFETPKAIPSRTQAMLPSGPDALVLEDVASEIRAELQNIGWRILLPLRVDQEVVGALALGGRRSGDPYFADHLDTLIALGHTAAAALKTFSLLQHRARAERLEDLQRLVDGLAHELGNQLAPIKTFARLVPERHMDKRFINDFARIVGRELGRMERLLDRLKRLAPATAAHHEVLDLRNPMHHALDVIRPVVAEKAIVVCDDLGSEALWVRGDVSELEELFLNLLTNAFEALAPLKSSSERIVFRAQRLGDEVLVSVEDSGPGISPLVIDKIFDPFVSTKARGSGLGLSICAGIISRHRARMEVNNLASGGAAFSVYIPLVP